MIALPTALLLTALFQVGPLAAEQTKPRAAGPALPADVQSVVTRLEGCRHWSGEEPYDAARHREIAVAVKKLSCATLDADEARLRRRHGPNPAVLKALDEARGTDG